MKDIPLHHLKNRVSSGLEMKWFSEDNIPTGADTLGVHRDDHYLFFLLGEGTASLMIDFKQLHFQGFSLYYILPGQVHHRIKSNVLMGWYLAVDTALVPADYRAVFESSLLVQLPVVLDQNKFEQCNQLVKILHDNYSQTSNVAFHLPVTYSLLQAFIGIAASHYSNNNDINAKASRPVELVRQFKGLLTQNLVKIKSPSAYAELMNVTEGYLNEVLKKMTGFSVSKLITNEVMLEAKRMLYYSTMNVKEIAHALGYQDHTYFSRLFKNSEGVSPLEFRGNHRE